MQLSIAAAAVGATILASSSASRAVIESRANVELPDLPEGCMMSYNNITMGWLPDDESDGAVSMEVLNADTGKTACFYGDYSKISSTSYDGSDITGKVGDTAGAIMVPAIMPTGVTWSEVDSTLAAKIGNVVSTFTDAGVTTYLRFAHEMNCYAKPGCATPEYPGEENYAEYKTAWINVANVCRGIDGCYMMWSPNLQDLDTLSDWYPGTEYIDIISVDHYPSSDSEVATGFAGNFGDFYTQFVEPNGLPFLIGETAYTGSLAEKDAWLKALTMGDFSDYPLYKGLMWFEYNKGSDNFYIVYGQDKAQENTVDENFE
ncbi:glycoside hydrolase superfamily [Xylariaceae sp. FL0804]|nr:glycoside hydrolase superfamily [Xylariaceae sp. FL0804]